MSLPPVFAASALYDNLLQAALRQFFGRATFETEPIPSLSSDGRLAIEPTNDPSVLTIRWFGSRHVLHVPARRPFTAHEVRLARAIGAVLAARYRAIFDPKQMLERGELFRGAIEDRYVARFSTRHRLPTRRSRAPTWSRRRSRCCAWRRSRATRTGRSRRACCCSTATTIRSAAAGVGRDGVYRYSQALTGDQELLPAVRRPADGVPGQPQRRASSTSSRSPRYAEPATLDVPCPRATGRTRSRPPATRNLCVVLSPSHEIKVFAEGVQIFSFRNARWHLLDLQAKYEMWAAAVGNRRAGGAAVPDGARPGRRARRGAVRRAARSRRRRCRSWWRPADQLDAVRHTATARCRRAAQLMYMLRGRNGHRPRSRRCSPAWRAPTARPSWIAGRLLAVGASCCTLSLPSRTRTSRSKARARPPRWRPAVSARCSRSARTG